MVKKLKILFLEPQPCIRALKYAIGLKNIGDYSLFFGYINKTLTEFYGTGDELFDDWIKLKKEGVEDLVDLLDSNNFDIIHSHNAPDYLTVKAINARRYASKTMPIIHDNHDVMTMRKTSYGKEHQRIEEIITEEYIANKFSDARIHVTSALGEYVNNFYGKSLDLVFNNFVPQELVPVNLLPKLSKKDNQIHIVYEGNVDEGKKGSHYDLIDIFDKITGKGFHLHIYTPRKAADYKILSSKNNLLHFHGKRSPKELLHEMTQYDFGWAGFNDSKNKKHLEVTLANKVMEYVSAGLPVISFPHKTQKNFLERNNLGIIISSIDELPKIFEKKDLESIKKTIEKKRFNFTIEKNIWKIERFYKKVLKSFK